MKEVESPCVGVCDLGPDYWCKGCYRTNDEIKNWLKYSDEERDAIMAEIETKRRR